MLVLSTSPQNSLGHTYVKHTGNLSSMLFRSTTLLYCGVCEQDIDIEVCGWVDNV